jgi:hypothetical protein
MVLKKSENHPTLRRINVQWYNDFAYLQGIVYIIFLRIVPMVGEQYTIIVKKLPCSSNKC